MCQRVHDPESPCGEARAVERIRELALRSRWPTDPTDQEPPARIWAPTADCLPLPRIDFGARCRWRHSAASGAVYSASDSMMASLKPVSSKPTVTAPTHRFSSALGLHLQTGVSASETSSDGLLR
jgi:hypothetical protein